jgi:hypothetical protein
MQITKTRNNLNYPQGNHYLCQQNWCDFLIGYIVFVHGPTHTEHAKRDYKILRSINKEKYKLYKEQQHWPDVYH